MTASSLPTSPEPAEIALPDFATFHDVVRPANRPAVMRGLVADWPAVAAARQGDRAMVDYIGRCGTTRPVSGLIAGPEENGRFFYNRQVTGFNFRKMELPLGEFLESVLDEANREAPHALAVQSEVIPELSPTFAAENRLALLPTVPPRIWIGNRVKVAPHFDLMENVACNVAGRRRFTLFPPEQISNLYPGPIEMTPAGTPISMVDPTDPDLERYPRYAEAWASALQVTLEPGDALYLPYGWWHGVQALEPLSILVNYWWSDAPAGVGAPYDAMLHALLAYRHLPPTEREVWRNMLMHFVFATDQDPAAHLPEYARGILGPSSPQLFARMRAMLRQTQG
jgi:hypothetical protein